MKLSVFSAFYKSVRSYGCKTTDMNSKIQALCTEYLLVVKGATLRDRVRNDKITKEVGTKDILEYLKEWQLSWLGHMCSGEWV